MTLKKWREVSLDEDRQFKTSYSMKCFIFSRSAHGKCVFHFRTDILGELHNRICCHLLGRIPQPHHGMNSSWFKVSGYMHYEVPLQRRELSKLHAPSPCCCEATSNLGEVASSHSRGGQESHQDILGIISGAVHEEGTFVEVSLRGKMGPSQPWRQLVVRPVLLKGKRQLQVGIAIGRFKYQF